MIEKRKLLVVDDIAINRVILKKILHEEYDVLEASNGKEALDILKEQGLGISLVLLDLVMPIMDGFAVLAAMKDDVELTTIPVIVITGNTDESNESKCLKNGATDFISKPFSVEVVRNRVSSMIRLRENANLLQQVKNDLLTGIYTREFFCQKVRNIINEHPNSKFDIICCDIVNFKLVNERYGRKLGDDLLQAIANDLRNQLTSDLRACGRISSNTFALLTEHREDYSNEKFIEATARVLKEIPLKNVVIKYGVYAVEDKGMPVSGMCDRAILAMGNIKHKYGSYFAYYDDSIRVRLLEEERVSEQMEEALKNREFVVYLQPEHDVKNNCVGGAEALVRWQHPTMGLVPPGVFIPVFERNGFITKVDAYVWEETCRLLRKWLDEGKQVVPVSVNISRMDFAVMHLKEYFVELVQKYKLPPELLHLEVTESAYMDNPEEMVQTVETLRQEGFKIDMDDFGSGYSSLNLLSDLPIDMLKVDMKFISKHKNAANNQGILSFIISLSKWLGLPTIVEGVETIEDLHLLIAMGCDYVQGYYFSKPIPSSEFMRYLETNNAKVAKNNKAEVAIQARDNAQEQHLYTVLLVEDVFISMNMLKEILGPYYNLLSATDGEAALKLLHEHADTINVVLMDLMMPVMDGFQLIKHMQEDEKLKTIPVVVTSEAGKDSEVRALKLGAENFVPKPYNKDILLHHLDSAIDRYELKKLRREIQQKNG